MIRVLFFADSHLGFDLPTRPRVRRRRRGHDFLANHERALEPALNPALHGSVDLVIHGGDVFHRSSVAPSLVHQGFEKIRRVADAGVPVFVAPGNHERSRIPHARFALHPAITVFDRPRTATVEIRGVRVAVAGFPYVRRKVRARFRDVVDSTGIGDVDADVRLLVIHHCVEGATVGPGNYTFRTSDDVIRGEDLPARVSAVLSGHIHRHQVLTHDLSGRPMPAPVFYPGSVERTSIAEMDEEKGYLMMELEPDPDGGEVKGWRFHPLPARPMVRVDADLSELGSTSSSALSWLRQTLGSVPNDAVLRVRIVATRGSTLPEALRAERLRRLCPASMNLELSVVDENGNRRWEPTTDSGSSIPSPLERDQRSSNPDTGESQLTLGFRLD